MKSVYAIASLLFLATSAGFAQDEKSGTTEKGPGVRATTVIRVETIQCGSCVRTVEKALKAVTGVESAKVDLKKKIATVTYQPAATTLAVLEEAISKSGYSANDKKADPAAYDKLDECCKIAEE